MSVFWPESDRKEKEDDKDAEDKSQPRSIRDRRRPREKRRSTGVSYWPQDVRNFCTLTQTCSIWTLVKAPICPQTWHISNECMPLRITCFWLGNWSWPGRKVTCQLVINSILCSCQSICAFDDWRLHFRPFYSWNIVEFDIVFCVTEWRERGRSPIRLRRQH